MEKEPLFGKTITELRKVSEELGMPSYAAGQLAAWLYKKRVSAVEEMTNLSKESRSRLDEKYYMGLTRFKKVMESADGTKKYLFPTRQKKVYRSCLYP
jgi:23S rRNA (adenine2503-C2)-methyltransferase